MQRIDIESSNPAHYKKVKATQDEMRQKCEGMLTVARLCPYCRHKVLEAAQGFHGYIFTKCEKCGYDIILPPLSFRIAKKG